MADLDLDAIASRPGDGAIFLANWERDALVAEVRRLRAIEDMARFVLAEHDNPLPDLTPSERSLRASIAANERWARTANKSDATASAREARWQKYLTRAADLAPAGATDDDIARRAEHLRQADMQRMALKSAQARKKAS